MPLTNEPLSGAAHPGYKKVVVISGVLLLLIIVAVAVWYFRKERIPNQQPLSDSEKAVIVEELNKISKDAPLTDEERYQMVTGRTMTATSSASTTPTKPRK